VAVEIAVATAILSPALVITLPALAALAVTVGIAGAVEFTSGVGQEVYEGFKDSKDLPQVRGHVVGQVNRSDIKSILHGVKLRDLAGDRHGTRGFVLFKDLLDGIFAHYVAAKRNWKSGGYDPKSCQEAENLCRMFAETDYHLSKMSAYAHRLKEIADAYVAFCDTNAAKVQQSYKDAKNKIMNNVLDQNEHWHKQHCHVNEHCYRTHKLSRMFTKAA
jgi:hypothetical protein